jgi:hypothetical protein
LATPDAALYSQVLRETTAGSAVTTAASALATAGPARASPTGRRDNRKLRLGNPRGRVPVRLATGRAGKYRKKFNH